MHFLEILEIRINVDIMKQPGSFQKTYWQEIRWETSCGEQDLNLGSFTIGYVWIFLGFFGCFVSGRNNHLQDGVKYREML